MNVLLSCSSSSSKRFFCTCFAMILFLSICKPALSDTKSESDALAKLPRELVSTTTVATFLPLTFLQNLVVLSNGDIVVNNAFDGRIWRVYSNGSSKLVGQYPGQAFSIAESPENGYIVVGLKFDGVVAAFHILESGEMNLLVDIEGAVFPNGLESLDGGRYIFADSIRGIIWEINYWERNFSVYLQDELLTPKPKPDVWQPGANGVRIFENKLFISSTNRRLLLSVELCDGKPIAGTLKIVKEKIFVDDFDFDEAGNLYIATHPLNVVQRMTPNGSISVIAGVEEGIRGNTACRFGRKSGDEKSLYAVVDGGIFNIGSDGLKPASVLRLQVDRRGAPGGSKTIISCAEKKMQHDEH